MSPSGQQFGTSFYTRRSSWTQSDYEMVAGVLRLQWENNPIYAVDEKVAVGVWINLRETFVKVFKEDNPKFDSVTFRKACGSTIDVLGISKNTD